MTHQLMIRRWSSVAALVCLLILAVGSTDGGGGGQSTTSKRSTSSTDWVKGGNLHNATVAQWKSATYANRLATSADWLASTKWKGHLNTPADFDRLKVKAAMVVRGVDQVAAEPGNESSNVRELAAVLITLADDVGPQ